MRIACERKMFACEKKSIACKTLPPTDDARSRRSGKQQHYIYVRLRVVLWTKTIILYVLFRYVQCVCVVCREEQHATSYRQMAASKLLVEQEAKNIECRLEKSTKKVQLYATKQESMRAMRVQVNEAVKQAAAAKRACARTEER